MKNILFAIADDASHFGCYGYDFVYTPHIDKLAENGAIFNNAFTCNPKCAPSRASILTGKYCNQLDDAMNHWCTFQAGEKFIPDYLEECGYRVGFTGKGWAPGDWQKNYVRNPAGNMFNKFQNAGVEGTCISKCDYALNFQDFIENTDSEKPFFFWFGCYEPHRPYVNGEGLRPERIKDVKVPSFLPDDDIVRKDFLDYAYEIEWFDAQLGKMVNMLEEKGMLDNTMIVVTSDNGCPFPRVKGQIYEADLRLPLVVWAKDLPKKSISVSEIINFVDFLPTFLDVAHSTADRSHLSGRSFYDRLYNVEKYIPNKYAYFQREKHDNGRENDLGYGVRAIRNERYLLVYNCTSDRYPAGNPETGYTNCDSSPTKDLILKLHEQGNHFFYNLAFAKRAQIELYDIVKDPDCIYNIAQKPEFEETICALFKDLLAFCVDVKDPRFCVSADYFDKKPLLTDGKPYSWKAYKEGRWEKQNF